MMRQSAVLWCPLSLARGPCKEGSRGMRGVGRRGLTVDCRVVDFSCWRDLIISCMECICKDDEIGGQHVFLPSN